jgi:hypothetical protein
MILLFFAYEKLLERASDNDLLLWGKSTSNKMRYRQWFDRCIISKMILKSGLSWLFLVVFSVESILFEVDFPHNKRSLSDARSKSFSYASVATATQIIPATLPLYSQNVTWRNDLIDV